MSLSDKPVPGSSDDGLSDGACASADGLTDGGWLSGVTAGDCSAWVSPSWVTGGTVTDVAEVPMVSAFSSVEAELVTFWVSKSW